MIDRLIKKICFNSAVNELGELAPRIGFFHTFLKSELVAKRWDSKLEDVSSERKKTFCEDNFIT